MVSPRPRSLPTDFPNVFSAPAVPEDAFRRAVKLGTHNGKFHCDEILALTMLTMLPKFTGSNVVIIRSRDPDHHSKVDLLVDVGGVYEPSSGRFDHHQRGFDTYFPAGDHGPRPSKLSSAGLVYLHFGKEILHTCFGIPEERVEMVWRKIYEDFIESVDAIDNGVAIAEGKLKYKDWTNLSSRISRLYPAWNDENQDDVDPFRRGLVLCDQEFREQVNRVIDTWLPAREELEKALKAGKEGSRVLVLKKWIPYQEHLYEFERHHPQVPPILFVIYPANERGYKIGCVGMEHEAFKSRLPFAERFRGLRDDELQKAGAPPGIHFVHHAGFIAGSTSLEGAEELAELTLREAGLH